jgi:hypothetical protein
MRPGRDLMDRRTDPRDVRCARYRNQFQPPLFARDGLPEREQIHRSVGHHSDMNHPGVLPPRKVVRVVFEKRRDDHVARHEAEAVRQLVDRLGRVLRKDDRRAQRISADETGNDIVRSVEGVGRDERFESRAAVNPRIPGKERGHGVDNPSQGGRACPVVEKDIGPAGAVQQRNLLVDADDLTAEVGQSMR